MHVGVVRRTSSLCHLKDVLRPVQESVIQLEEALSRTESRERTWGLGETTVDAPTGWTTHVHCSPEVRAPGTTEALVGNQVLSHAGLRGRDKVRGGARTT